MTISIADILNKNFGVKNCKTMCMGVTLIDTDPAAGRVGIIDAVKHPHQWSPINALTLYPTIENYEKPANGEKKKADLSMSCCWMTCFSPLRRGMPSTQNMSSNSQNFLDGRSVNTTPAILGSRPDDILASIYAHMRWYGTNNRLIDVKHASSESTDRIVNRGWVSKSWTKNPVQVRYVARIVSTSNDVKDYFYTIGGSDDIIGDNLDEIPKNIVAWYEQIKNLKEESKKGKGKKSEAEDEWAGADPKNLWFAYEKNPADASLKASLLAKKILRTVEGIILIRNYFAYAKNGIGLDEVYEFESVNSDGSAKFKTVNIDEILKKYDRIYAYCKNLCYIFKDIGAGDIM